jgi:hypothetical protein
MTEIFLCFVHLRIGDAYFVEQCDTISDHARQNHVM